MDRQQFKTIPVAPKVFSKEYNAPQAKRLYSFITSSLPVEQRGSYSGILPAKQGTLEVFSLRYYDLNFLFYKKPRRTHALVYTLDPSNISKLEASLFKHSSDDSKVNLDKLYALFDKSYKSLKL